MLAELDAEVAHVVLHEAERGDRPRFGSCIGLRDFADFRTAPRSVAAATGEERGAPLRDIGPGPEFADSERRRSVVPARLVTVVRERRHILLLPDRLDVRANDAGGERDGRMLQAKRELTRRRCKHTRTAVNDGMRRREGHSSRHSSTENGVLTDDAPFEVDDVADAQTERTKTMCREPS